MQKISSQSALKQNREKQFTILLPIDGMTCTNCVRHVEKAINKLHFVDTVNVNPATNMASITSQQKPDLAAVKTAIEKAGYKINEQKITFNIEGMTCASCVRHIEKALKNTFGVVNAIVNLVTNQASIDYIGNHQTVKAMINAVEKVGYKAQPLSMLTPKTIDKTSETKKLLHSFIIAFLLTLPIFALEMIGHIIPSFHAWLMLHFGEKNNRLFQFICTSCIIFGPGWRFLKAGIPALFRGYPNMNSLVSVGALTAWCYSSFATFLAHYYRKEQITFILKLQAL